jgi:predicted ATPase
MSVLSFIRDFVSYTIQYAVQQQTDNFRDLVYGREDNRFDLAIEALMPEDRRAADPSGSYTHVRYDLSVRWDMASNRPVVESEKVGLFGSAQKETRIHADRSGSQVRYVSEDDSQPGFQGNVSPFDSVLSYLPRGPNSMPTLKWFANLVGEGVRDVRLKPDDLHIPPTEEAAKASRLTGAYLARSVSELRDKSRESFEAWIKHVRTALPDLDKIRIDPDQQQRLRQLLVRYQNGIEVPSRVLSDGTLCLLALTILAYMPESSKVYLIEEPENAVHPTAIDTIYQSLSSIYDGQVLVASHSPILLASRRRRNSSALAAPRRGRRSSSARSTPCFKNGKGK